MYSDTVHFYSTSGPYGCFSNFSKHPVVVEGLEYPTSEHFYQSQKFRDFELREKIRLVETAKEAARLGRQPHDSYDPEWESIKDQVMFIAVAVKVVQNKDVMAALVSTGNMVIVEDTKTDLYWGCGESGLGKNQLGKTLMAVREMVKHTPSVLEGFVKEWSGRNW